MTSLPDISSAPLPVAYARARQELAKCWRVDECKTRADKMQALASYAKQSRDKRLYEVALRIQARADPPLRRAAKGSRREAWREDRSGTYGRRIPQV